MTRVPSHARRDRPAPGCEVLLVEDDALLRRRLAAYFGSLKAVVTEAADLDGARCHLAAHRFVYALMDPTCPTVRRSRSCTTAYNLLQSAMCPIPRPADISLHLTRIHFLQVRTSFTPFTQ